MKTKELEETTTIKSDTSGSKKRSKKIASNSHLSAKTHPKKKKKGGRFVFSLIVILGVAGWVFWLGWVQLDLPENTYGIVHTKTRGYYPVPVAPEGITWLWEKVIPTNTTIHLFEIKTESVTINEKGELPMADLYASVIEEKVDFSYQFTANISYKIDPQSLVGLIKTGKISQEENGQWELGIQKNITSTVKNFLYEKISTSTESTTPEIRTIEKELEKSISSLVPEIEIEEIQIKRFNRPGSDIYAIAKERYKERLNTREIIRDQLMGEALVDNENFDQTIKRIEKMGAVLEKHPILLDYFKMNPTNGINDFKPEGK